MFAFHLSNLAIAAAAGVSVGMMFFAAGVFVLETDDRAELRAALIARVKA